MSDPVEITTRFATNVEAMSDAWAFVMARIDRVGPDPTIYIKPVWVYPLVEMEMIEIGQMPQAVRRFEVVVQGSGVEETEQPEEVSQP